jgi:hypothetical protein
VDAILDVIVVGILDADVHQVLAIVNKFLYIIVIEEV